jgi:hypothetical protein
MQRSHLKDATAQPAQETFMSNADQASFPDFGKLVPGFDFLQNLTKQAAGSATPGMQLPSLGSWIAPTLNVEELDKRIQELKAVQFWLDQNAMALKATIQALEVQKMTLATLKGMNFNMSEMANAFKVKSADSMAGSAQAAPDKSKSFAGLEIPPSAFQASKAASDQPRAEAADATASSAGAAETPAGKAPASPAGVVDPMQWWGALTQQFQTIAADAMKEAAKKTAIDTSKNIAAGMAKDAMKSATDMATGLAKGLTEAADKSAGGARAAMSSALRSSQAWPTPVAGKTATRAKPNAAEKEKSSAPAGKKVARKTAR